MKVVVTGITGKTGYWFYQKLLAEQSALADVRFRVASRSKSAVETMCNQCSFIEPYIGDINDAAFCMTLCEGADTLIHIAGIRQ